MQKQTDEILKCPSCGSPKVRVIIPGANLDFSLYKCGNCGKSIQGRALIKEGKDALENR